VAAGRAPLTSGRLRGAAQSSWAETSRLKRRSWSFDATPQPCLGADLTSVDDVWGGSAWAAATSAASTPILTPRAPGRRRCLPAPQKDGPGREREARPDPICLSSEQHATAGVPLAELPVTTGGGVTRRPADSIARSVALPVIAHTSMTAACRHVKSLIGYPVNGYPELDTRPGGAASLLKTGLCADGGRGVAGQCDHYERDSNNDQQRLDGLR
jgi:hypothetical protein